MTQKTVNLLNGYGLNNVESVIEHCTDCVNILDQGNLITNVKVNYPFRIVNRTDFDNWLLQEYLDIGGVALLGEKVTKIDFEQKRVETTNEEVTFDYIIAADGAKGITSTVVKRKPIKYAFGVEMEVPTDTVLENSDAIDLDVTIAKDGYAWRFPRHQQTLFGLAFSYDRSADYVSILRDYTKRNEKIRGAFLPYGGVIKTVVDNRGMLLVGDAAGFVDAITGEGTYYAIKSGEIAAAAFTAKDPLIKYEQDIKPIVREVNKSCKLIKKFYKFRRLILSLAKGHGDFVKFVCDNQVSLQKCDFSVIKMVFKYKKSKLLQRDY